MADFERYLQLPTVNLARSPTFIVPTPLNSYRSNDRDDSSLRGLRPTRKARNRARHWTSKMPPSSRYSRASSRSPTRSTSFTSTSTGQSRTQIVKRLAITGKAQRSEDGEEDGAAIKMFLRMKIPANSVTPGSTVPLFPEENLKILRSMIHPLDGSFAPYNFSTTAKDNAPLLKAMRVLNLPNRLKDSYTSLFGGSPSSFQSSTSSGNPYDFKYTGQILVSGYHISYVLPKLFPPRVYETENFNKRSANDLHFMAVIELWVPYVSMPPYSPYLVSLPVPRCLSNQIRLRIFPPGTTPLTSSMASLSSAESDSASWDLTTDPPVSRNGRKGLNRNNPYNSFADDESSDSSGSAADGYGVQGSFPSTDRIRIRWAAPVKAGEVPETSDRRRRVGIRDVKSDMTCSVLRRDKGRARGRRGAEEGGVIVKVEYTATCKGVRFPGVATMLGMDVALDVQDCEVSWAPDGEGKWTVTGGAGFTGFGVGPPPNPALSRQSSANAPPILISPSSPRKPEFATPKRVISETNSRSSASLLRAPLPSSPNPSELSFDESPSATPLSSMASLATIPSDPERERRSRASSTGRDERLTDTDTDSDKEQRPPKVPITIHLNMNELGPPSNNEFTFSVSGTIMIRPQEDNTIFTSSPVSPVSPITSGSTASDNENEIGAVMPIPRFNVLYTDKETISTIVLNETDTTSLDIYNSTGNIADAQSRKTVLQPGGKTKCSSDGGRFALRSAASSRPFLRREDSTESLRRPPSRPRTPSWIPRNASTSSFYRERQSFSVMGAKVRRDGPLMIPSVTATITPLVPRNSTLPSDYAVRVTLPAPADAESEWLEFGLAQPPKTAKAGAKVTGSSSEKRPPDVKIAIASVEGVPMQFETSPMIKPDTKLPALGLTFEETSAKEWITWVKIHVGDGGGGNVEVVYVVKADENSAVAPEQSRWQRLTGKGKAKSQADLDVLLPTFSLPVGTMEVNIGSVPGVEYVVKSNLTHQQATSSGFRLLVYSVVEFFYPNLTISMSLAASSQSHIATTSWRTLGFILCMMSTVMALLAMADKQVISAELAQAQQSLESYSAALQTSLEPPDPVTITITTTAISTVTTTVYMSSLTQGRWWNTQSSSEADTGRPTPPEIISPPSSTLSTSPTIATFVASESTSPTPTLSQKQTAVSVIRDMPFLWPISFDIPSLEIPERARIVGMSVWRGVNIAWNLFQRILHYPLEPPY